MARLAGVRAVLFDAVGTLMYPSPPVAEVYYALGQKFGSRLTAEEIADRFAFAVSAPSRVARGLAEDSGREYYLDRPPTDHEREHDRWRHIVAAALIDVKGSAHEPFEALWDHFAEPCHWRIYDDVAATWRALESSGLLLGVASNFDDRLAGVCRGLPPLDRCEHVYWSARVGWPKPSPHFFAHVQESLGLAPQEILLVGDDYENDYVGAIVAGWQALHLERGEGGVVAARHLIRDLREVVQRMQDDG